MPPFMRVLLCTLALSPTCTHGLDNGMGTLPPMGLSTWSVFRTNVNDTLIRQLADAMVSSGMAAVGFTSLLVDDGWEGQGCKGCLPNRDEQGNLVVDPMKFPLGMKATAS
jgi:alpha-galactosidase